MLNIGIPTIDLHGENKVISRILVEEFIKDNIKLKNPKIMIIHGIGKGILRKEVNMYLQKCQHVKSFYLDFMNPGCTIVELNLN